MNIFRLFTSDNQQFWVTASDADRAIRHVESLSGQRVSCWFIGGSRPANATVLNA